MTPSRVLMTADTVGGVFSYSLDLARALAPHGVRVVLATMGGPASEAQRREAASVPGLRLVESRFRLEWMDEPWEDVARAGAWLLDLAARCRPDLVLRADLGRRARARARAFTPERMAGGYLDVYASLLQAPGESLPPSRRTGHLGERG